MAELSVKVPIRFSEKAQKDLYEMCMAYKELAEMRGAENAKLRELVRKWYPHMLKRVGRDALEQWGQMDVVKEPGIEVDR